jgi:hypothetical protein
MVLVYHSTLECPIALMTCPRTSLLAQMTKISLSQPTRSIFDHHHLELPHPLANEPMPVAATRRRMASLEKKAQICCCT